MYDWIASGNTSAIFFDVFFEIVPEGDAYLVRIDGLNSFQAYERPIGSTAPLTSGGAFDVGSGSGWTPLDAGDLALANFHVALGLGPSPANGAPHALAEFDMTIDHASDPIPGANGFYSPDPAFWGASAKNNALDPPISSAIFELNPDGSIDLTPVLNASGAPVMQGSVTTPEPGGWALILTGLGVVFGLRRLRQ